MDRFDPRLRRTALPEQSTKKKRDREKNFKKKEKRVHTCVDIADGDSVSSNDENGRRSLGEVMRKGSIKRTKVRDDEGTLGGRFAAYFGGTNDSFFFAKGSKNDSHMGCVIE
jgi:hypothetical protein